MAEMKKCPQCGEDIPGDGPEGLCPNCLLKVNLQPDESQSGSEPGFTSPYSGHFVPPQPAELAPHFPQLEILELLGQGGMAAVYKARQPGLDRLVALKILPREIGADPAFAERFTREARALARLSHPNIVAVYDFGRTAAGLFYFLMEFVDGVNLRQAIRAGSMSPKEALAIVPQICDALQFAHDEGIVHRDIKPENVLLDKRGRVKIADFGLAKLLGHAPGGVSLTGTQQVMGTLRYMAPEQMEGTKAVDHRADIYSLGVVFYELLTGEVPVGRFAPPSKKVQIDVRLDEVVLRALEEKPEQRYQHASEVKTAVENVTSRPAGAVSSVAPPAPQAPVDYINQFLGFLMTPQPGFGKAVGIPMLIVAGIWMVLSLAVTFLVPQERKLVHETTMLGNYLLVPLGFLYLTVAWKICQKIRTTGVNQLAVVVPVTLCCVVITVSLVLWLAPARWFGGREPWGLSETAEMPPAPQVTTLKSFSTTDPTIFGDLVVEDGGWFANCTEPRTIPLFEVTNPGVEDCQIIYRAQLKTEKLKGRAYLEMWCRLPGSGEFFSRGLDHVATGSTAWASHETPFFLKKGEKPELLRLNLVVEGTGRVGIRNIEVLTNAKQLPPERKKDT
ncbi:MAG: serine/threonine-protein kinase [Thermoguttaceae bacterium]|jgi:predicted Ser/Thr protein kinase|nr:serine/threonine-protein kinase [Thermoguttaceae bacterium]